jgi:hypothetical protein
MHACGNRRQTACPPCSTVYRADQWQLIAAGLRGGIGVPSRSRRIRGYSPPSPRPASAPSTPAASTTAGPGCVGPAAPASYARTAAQPGAAGATARTTRRWGSRSARTASTTPPPCCGTRARRNCGDAPASRCATSSRSRPACPSAPARRRSSRRGPRRPPPSQRRNRYPLDPRRRWGLVALRRRTCLDRRSRHLTSAPASTPRTTGTRRSWNTAGYQYGQQRHVTDDHGDAGVDTHRRPPRGLWVQQWVHPLGLTRPAVTKAQLKRVGRPGIEPGTRGLKERPVGVRKRLASSISAGQADPSIHPHPRRGVVRRGRGCHHGCQEARERCAAGPAPERPVEV